MNELSSGTLYKPVEALMYCCDNELAMLVPNETLHSLFKRHAWGRWTCSLPHVDFIWDCSFGYYANVNACSMDGRHRLSIIDLRCNIIIYCSSSIIISCDNLAESNYSIYCWTEILTWQWLQQSQFHFFMVLASNYRGWMFADLMKVSS